MFDDVRAENNYFLRPIRRTKMFQCNDNFPILYFGVFSTNVLVLRGLWFYDNNLSFYPSNCDFRDTLFVQK